ncbi:kinase domain protein (macronuclear) [Tetrahymena thermophila SB210]|uniref:Kinase domain protein n=1 Tax=Tetrahymena thermophila (strain SB210) TaxID=312017 RepID=W7X4G2_TETTS|nr:kinase domain protein [Tetrahymena thermophila SB210]EWS72287.1 kinase domain protein [Tetrahymena thermophila SB210]|eukprot:XP_012655227.1 kinase domain protein [Tetrahymena thermophila SB210]
MLESNKDIRLMLNILIQNLNTFFVNESSLKKLKLSKQITKYKMSEDKDIKIVRNYEIIEMDFKSLLAYKQFKEQAVKDIGMIIEKCQDFTNLIIQNISLENVNLIEFILQKCKHITSLCLGLYDTKLGPERARNIDINLENCQNVACLYLNLADNKLGPEGAKSIGMSLEALQNITSLTINLQNNDLRDEGINKFGLSLEKCQSISYLNINLQSNLIGHEGIINFGMSLLRCLKINSLTLNFDRNGLTQENIINFGAIVQKFQNLKYFNLFCRFTNQSFPLSPLYYYTFFNHIFKTKRLVIFKTKIDI